MKILRASKYPFSIKLSNPNCGEIYPFFRDDNGDIEIRLVSPQHGRSYVVGQTTNGRWIISKGNGLSYSSQPYLCTPEQNRDIWGLLLERDGVRDFHIGNQVASLGILTNKMEYVIELDHTIRVQNNTLNPILLQYSVKCPYRISDAQFIAEDIYMSYVKLWSETFGINKNLPFHLQAAEVLCSNLSRLHRNKLLHNAITSQNYTWALELLDFELSCSPKYPYELVDYQRHHLDLFEREKLHTYQIIIDIAGILKEDVNWESIESIFNKNNVPITNNI